MTIPHASVVYVTLGGRRTRAARWSAAQLAAAGAPVLLVVADLGEWADADIAAGVTVHRLPSADPTKALRAARRFLFGRGGPLRDAGLLVLGDPEATPLAAGARRRFVGLDVRLTSLTGAEGRLGPADLAVVTPWYPGPNDPFAGAFVQAATAAVTGDGRRVCTLHTENWFYSPRGIAGKLVGVSLAREATPTGGVVVEDTPEGPVARVVTPQLTSANYAVRAQEQIQRLADVLPTGRIEAPLVHAHTGHYAGAVATALARDDARVVVTEHATFLADVFAQRAARTMYGDMLARADRVLCVSRSLKGQIVETFPAYADKIRIVPNPIDFDRFAVRPNPPTEPLRWLYVGRMLEHKGVRTLLDAFALVARDEPRATLTLVGSGNLTGSLRERIAHLGLADRVTQRAAVAPEVVAEVLAEHDLLVHASRIETFGVTLVEAIATGTPVLAARSAGPAETLAGLDGVAGVLFPVTEDPGVIVAAYHRLCDAWDRLDLPAARERLRARYGSAAVGAALREVYRQVLEEPGAARASSAVPAPAPPAPDVERVAVVAVDRSRQGRVIRYVDGARNKGYAVDLIALEPSDWNRYAGDRGVRIHGIGEAEERRLGLRLERAVVTVAPRWALGFLRARAAALPSPVPEAVVVHAQHCHRVLSGGFNSKVYDRLYNVVRPRILWRITRRRVLPQLDLSRTRAVVAHGVAGVTASWGLARHDPTMTVKTELTPPAEEASVRP